MAQLKVCEVLSDSDKKKDTLYLFPLSPVSWDLKLVGVCVHIHKGARVLYRVRRTAQGSCGQINKD